MHSLTLVPLGVPNYSQHQLLCSVTYRSIASLGYVQQQLALPLSPWVPTAPSLGSSLIGGCLLVGFVFPLSRGFLSGWFS